jgi:DNA-binding IclR family transcriptional regulator
MPRRAPAIERSIAVLNLLAAHPGERYSLSEIARDLKLNKATLHAALWALTDEGYLVRDPEAKTYGLGPALVALGSAARSSQPAVDFALPEMEALVEDLRLDCVASTAIHDEIVIVARAGTPQPFGIAVLPGQRIPLMPPIGAVFVAWKSDRDVKEWVAKLGDIGADALARFRKAVDAVRDRGYSVGLEGDTQLLLQSLRPGRGVTVEEGIQGMRKEEYALVDVDPKASYRLSHIGAPVFGPEGSVTLGLFLIGFQGEIKGKDVGRLADRLTAAAERVTKSIHGVAPESTPS